MILIKMHFEQIMSMIGQSSQLSNFFAKYSDASQIRNSLAANYDQKSYSERRQSSISMQNARRRTTLGKEESKSQVEEAQEKILAEMQKRQSQGS